MESPAGGGGLGLLLNAAVMRAKLPLSLDPADCGGAGEGELTALDDWGPPGLIAVALLLSCDCCAGEPEGDPMPGRNVAGVPPPPPPCIALAAFPPPPCSGMAIFDDVCFVFWLDRSCLKYLPLSTNFAQRLSAACSFSSSSLIFLELTAWYSLRRALDSSREASN